MAVLLDGEALEPPLIDRAGAARAPVGVPTTHMRGGQPLHVSRHQAVACRPEHGLGNGPRPVVEEFDRIKTNYVNLPTSAGRQLRIRCVTKPDESQRIQLGGLGLTLPARLGELKWEDSNGDGSQNC